jgi:hypothetical protein
VGIPEAGRLCLPSRLFVGEGLISGRVLRVSMLWGSSSSACDALLFAAEEWSACGQTPRFGLFSTRVEAHSYDALCQMVAVT